ncbi:putative glycoside hydrolase [Leptospira sp. 96542]|nr:putative glycoside hydrolase [Leptospira sp. 96542]
MKFKQLLTVYILFSFCNSPNLKSTNPSDARLNQVPSFIEGLYINTKTIRDKKRWSQTFAVMKEAGMNTAIVDIQPIPPTPEQMEEAKSLGMYMVARVVNFEGGLTEKTPNKNLMLSIQKYINKACELGFSEIQLDYIRFSDGGTNFQMSYEKRYEAILTIIKDHKSKTLNACGADKIWTADVFGRVPFIENDIIGQKIEPFSEELDGLYPMLYPSHFYGLTKRVSDPYQTVKDGLDFTVERAKKGTKAIAWIQGFNMMVGPSKLSYIDYIKVQMLGAKHSKGHGFIVWNAGNEYFETMKAYEKYKLEVMNPIPKD